LRQPILVDTCADMLVYGMGEKAITEIATNLMDGRPLPDLVSIPQTAFITKSMDDAAGGQDIILPSHEQCRASKKIFAAAFRTIEEESNKFTSCRLIEPVAGGFLVVNPPYEPLSTDEIDAIYALPFTRLPHQKYDKKGDIPAYDMIKHSVNIHRGCFGGCSFCTISAHQGKFIASRSEESILHELTVISGMPDFRGHVTDLGGPSANMYQMRGNNQETCKKCKRPSCIWPAVCPNLNASHQPLIALYRKVRELSYIKQATIGSGIRYDLLMNDEPSSKQYKTDVIKHHVSGRLKVAPEHTCDHVLKAMRKPPFSLFEEFYQEFTSINKLLGLRQQLVPYFISSHPSCTLDDMRQLATKLKHLNIQPEQVQDFTPTPMTLASVMFYTGIDPYTGTPIQVTRSKEGKLEQKEKFFWKKF